MGMIKDTKAQFSVLLRLRPRYVIYIFLGILLFAYGWFYAANGTIEGPELTIFRALNNLPQFIGIIFILITLFGAIGTAWLISIVLLMRRRYAFAIQLWLAAMLAWWGAKFLKMLGTRPRPYDILQNVNVLDIKDTAMGYPSGHMAVATAAALVIGQRLSPKGRRILYIFVGLIGVSRIVLGMHGPLDIVGGFAVGLVAGSIINLILGTPTRRFLPAEISGALKRAGFMATGITQANVDARGSAPYFGKVDGKPVFIKIVDSDNTIADWIFKFTRRILYRRLEDELPFFNAKRQLEHEALMALLAKDAGIKTPSIIGVCHISGASWALIQEGLDGKSLDKVDPKTITDAQLEQVWELVEKLHSARIAHRDLRTANILRDTSNNLWLIDFGFAELSPGKQGVTRDKVEMLASMATLVGPERAVASANHVVTRAQLAAALPYMQYAVLSGATTKQVKKMPGGIKAIREAIVAFTHQKAPVTIERIRRINVKALAYIIIFILLAVAVIPRMNQLKDGLKALTTADPKWIIVAVIASIITYFAAAITYVVLARVPLSYFKTLGVQVAASFANRLIPSGVGGLSLNVDFLIKSGHKATEAASVTAVNSAAAFVSYVILLFSALVITKTSPLTLLAGKSIPPWVIAVVVIVVAIVSVVLWNWKWVRDKVTKFAKDALKNVVEYRHEPFRLVLAVLGASLVTIAYVAALYASAHSIGMPVTVVQAFVAYTIGTLIGAAVPTPGGLGGVEAGLYAGLIAFGYPPGEVLSTIIIYRLMTFWLPILPGYLSFWLLQRNKII
ncbi:MAG: flippase-like domain-containing protein [Candidatus Saccharimonadales bacterium]